MKKRCILGIDWQNDFMDYEVYELPNDQSGNILERSTLPVNGASADAKRTSEWTIKNKEKFHAVYLTQDSHHELDIAHPSMWNKADGTPVDPFTPISHQDILNGKFVPRIFHKRLLNYVKALEDQGEFGHFIWPPHCLMGTWGHNFHPAIQNMISEFERRGLWVNFITKGSNPFTEHFGFVRANIPDPNDPSTFPNQDLLNNFNKFDDVLITGQARSHCVANSLKQLLEVAPDLASKLVVMEDCMSNVAGLPDAFYVEVDKIYEDARNAGVRFETTLTYKF